MNTNLLICSKRSLDHALHMSYRLDVTIDRRHWCPGHLYDHTRTAPHYDVTDVLHHNNHTLIFSRLNLVLPINNYFRTKIVSTHSITPFNAPKIFVIVELLCNNNNNEYARILCENIKKNISIKVPVVLFIFMKKRCITFDII